MLSSRICPGIILQDYNHSIHVPFYSFLKTEYIINIYLLIAELEKVNKCNKLTRKTKDF